MNKSPSESIEEQENNDLRPPSPSSDPRISKEKGWRDENSEGDEYALRTTRPSSRHSDTPWKSRTLPKRQKRQRRTTCLSSTSVAQPAKAPAPTLSEAEIVRFPKLDPNEEAHVDLLTLARPARALPGETDDGMTHEVFAVLTAYCDDDTQGDQQGLWGNILGFAARLGVTYKGLHDESHVWAPFVEQLLRAFDFENHYGYLACHGALCVGLGSNRNKRERAAALGAVAWRAQKEPEYLRDAMREDSGISPFFQALANTKPVIGGRNLMWNGVRMKIVLVRCCEGAVATVSPPPRMSPPSEPHPEVSLGHIDDYTGVTPKLARKSPGAAPPWHERVSLRAAAQSAAYPWHGKDGERRVQLRKGPREGKYTGTMHSVTVDGPSASHANSTTANRQQAQSGGRATARLVRRTVESERHSVRVPPPPPPPPRLPVSGCDSLSHDSTRRPWSRPACKNDCDTQPIGEKRSRRHKQSAVIPCNQRTGHSPRRPQW